MHAREAALVAGLVAPGATTPQGRASKISLSGYRTLPQQRGGKAGTHTVGFDSGHSALEDAPTTAADRDEVQDESDHEQDYAHPKEDLQRGDEQPHDNQDDAEDDHGTIPSRRALPPSMDRSGGRRHPSAQQSRRDSTARAAGQRRQWV